MAPLPKMAPHTAAKHLLLKRYLDRWFPILGKYNRIINYIDGFAGPGEYEGGETGSPLLAIEAAKYHVDHGTLPDNVTINFIFVEAKPDYADHLVGKLNGLTNRSQFRITVINGRFANVISGILDRLEKESKFLDPMFAFVDPFGFSGIPFDLMGRILSYPRCEIFVNIMVEFINRFIDHPLDRIVEHLPTTFGTTDVLKIVDRPGDRIRPFLKLYQDQLKTKAKFVGRFDMHGSRDKKTYSLFFASNSSRGFEKMKETMWSVDKAEGGRFSDFKSGAADQPNLFLHAALWDEMMAKFRGQRVPMAEIERFVIEETDSYLPKHARAVLKEKEGTEISVEIAPGQKRRKGDFPVEKVTIVFPSEIVRRGFW